MKALDHQHRSEPWRPDKQPRQGALNALRVLETCPFVPVDAFVHLAGLSSLSSAYQQLARLRRGGLAKVTRIDPGYLVGDRPLGCWTITNEGRRVLGFSHRRTPGEVRAVAQEGRVACGPRTQARITDRDLPLLIATYRLLASLVLERSVRGQVVEVTEWEWPLVREWRSDAEDKLVRVKAKAGAGLRVRERIAHLDQLTHWSTEALLVPDLGTLPVVHNREMLRRLAAFREASRSPVGAPDSEPELVIATPDPDGSGARIRAWLELLSRIGRRYGEPSARVRVLSWEWVSDTLTQARSGHSCGNDGHGPGGWQSRPAPGALRRRGPARSQEQLLHLIGRHPCLTVDHLANLLGTTVHRIKRLETQLIEDGLLRRIEFYELPRGGTAVNYEDFSGLHLVEISNMGRRRLAGWLGISQAAASRYHGVTGNARSEGRRRWRLLRALAHTLGANNVFVAFAMAAHAVRRAGGSDDLVEWRGAAACERNYCKPDGYGCYVRDGVPHGFFLEYDRGTERDRNYAAKVRAYYRYRDTGQAARDYRGFPTILFVTTQPFAEQRIAEQSYRAAFIRATEPLPLLTTNVELISKDPEGILGRIWRPGSRSDSCLPRQYWLPGRLPRDFSHVHASAATQLGR